MAIDLHKFQKQWEDEEERTNDFDNAAYALMERMRVFRETRLALGLPFCGRLAESYQKIYDGLSRLSVGDVNFTEGEALEEALESVDQLGGFLNLEIGPGNKTVRDALRETEETLRKEMSPKAARELKGLAEDLTAVSEFLDVSVKTTEPPLFNYWQDNEREPEAEQLPEAPEAPEMADVVLSRKLNALRAGNPNDSPERPVAELFGARIAANAERDNKALLKVTGIRESQVRANTQKLMAHPLFQRFVEQEKQNLFQLSRKRGHGGLLEEQFKKFLLNLPGGELRNDPILARYMPSYKERIEVLKQEIARKPGSSASEAMAEIVVLRGLAKTDRHRVGRLEQPIATDPSNRLENCTKILAYKNDFLNGTLSGRTAAAHGHGGQMVENIRAWERQQIAAANPKNRQPAAGAEPGDGQLNLEAEPVNRQPVEAADAPSWKPSEFTKLMLNKTTYRGRILDLKVRAALLLEEINRGRTVDEAVKMQYRAMCLENFGLSNEVIHRGRSAESDVDEKSVALNASIAGEGNKYSPANTRLLRKEDVTGGLRAIVEAKGMNYDVPKHFPLRVNEKLQPRVESLANLDEFNLGGPNPN